MIPGPLFVLPVNSALFHQFVVPVRPIIGIQELFSPVLVAQNKKSG